MRRLTVFLFIASAVLLASPAWCNPVAATKLGMLPVTAPFDYIVDLFFIILALLIVRRARTVPIRRVLWVAVLAMIAGLCADAIGALAAGFLAYTDYPRPLLGQLSSYHRDLVGFVGRIAFPVPLILAANYVLGRIGFGMNRREALWYGLMVGLATAPFESAELAWSHETDASGQLIALALLAFGLGDLILLLVLRRGRQAGLPVKLTIAACALVLVAVSIPIRVHQIGTEIVYLPERACRRQLLAVRTALEKYGRDHPDQLPEELGLLVPKYLPKPELLCCPVHERGDGGPVYFYGPPEDDHLRGGTMCIRCPVHWSEVYAYGLVKQDTRN